MLEHPRAGTAYRGRRRLEQKVKEKKSRNWGKNLKIEGPASEIELFNIYL
jgi:hypothetical protein